MCFTKYYKNFILCGDADHYCLLCDETFNTTDKIETHVRWEKHRKALKNLSNHSKLGMVRKDGIHKIKNYYYCQYCNSLMKNMTSVKEHINANEHQSSKSAPESKSKRLNVSCDATTATVNDIKVDINFWHCLENQHCVLCGVNIENITHSHIHSIEHIFGLIQLKLECDGDKCFRRINKKMFQCFTCEKILPSDEFNSHFSNKGHNNNEETKDNPIEKIKISDFHQMFKLRSTEFDITKYKGIEDELFDIDFDNRTIRCKICKCVIKTNVVDLENHILLQHKIHDAINKSNLISQLNAKFNQQYFYLYENDHGKTRSELARYGKENYIKLNAGGSKGYCTLCDRQLSSHINVFKQHVSGSNHIGHLELKGELRPRKHKKGSTKSEPLVNLSFNVLPELEMVGVNMTILVNKYSFFLIKRIEHGTHFKKTKCFVCDEVFEWGNEKKHCQTKVHKDYVLAAKVLQNINFIREIHPKLYHCGFCNLSLPFWESVERHRENISHIHVENNYMNKVTQFYKKYERVPDAINIEMTRNADVLYSRILDSALDNHCNNYNSFILKFMRKCLN